MATPAGLQQAEKFFEENLTATYTEKNVTAISIQDAYAKVEKGEAVLVDTRPPAALDVSRIKGAITPEELWEKKEKGELAGKTVVTQCYIGGGSCNFILENKEKFGDIPVASAKLGLIGAAYAGIPIVDKEGKETKTVHCVPVLKGMFPEDFTEQA